LSDIDNTLRNLFNTKDLENNFVDSIENKTAEQIEEEIQDEPSLKISDNVDKSVIDDNNEPVTSLDIQFVIETISKQAPYDKTQIKQIFYGICSSQSSTKIHHNINSKKSGEGKSYLLKLVSDLFPDSFTLKFNNMSDKALYHQNGIEAVKNEETGKYEELKPIIKQLELEIEELQEKIEQSNDKQYKRSLKSQIKEIEIEIIDLKSKAVKIIDLDDKAFIFLDTPNEGLFNNLMSILSQDSKEQQYLFTDKDSFGKRLQSKTVILRGSPLIMSTQVVDDTRNYRFAEKNRRFIHVNPNTSDNKIQEALRQITIKLSGSPDDFESIVSSEDIKKSKEIIAKLCRKLKDHNQKNIENDIAGNAVKIPYASILCSNLPTSDSWSMTVLTRLLNYIAIITKVSMDSRPKLVDIQTGISFPVSIYDDLKEALKIMETASLSIRPYQQDWLTNVFLPAFEELNPEPNCKKNDYGTVFATESVVGLTTKQIVDNMNQIGINASISNVYDAYLRPLIKQGFINYNKSVLNGKENLYYPANISDTENDLSISILPLTDDCRLILNKPFDEKNVLEESFRTIIEQRSKEGGDENSKKYKIIDIDGSELSVSELLERYFFSDRYPSSCSVILQKFHNNTIEHYSIGEQIKTNGDEEKSNQLDSLKKEIDNLIDDTTTIESDYSTYRYTPEQIEEFFASENEQQEEHTLEGSICRPLIGRQNHKPFFYYCNEHPKVENINLVSIENHIRLKDPERHKAKLLEYLERDKRTEKIS
jgi:hypothetical protein